MFYDCFKYACATHGVSMTEVLHQCGLSAGNLSRWKRGETPKSSTIMRISDMLGIEPTELLKEPPPVKRDGRRDDDVLEAMRIMDSLTSEKRKSALDYLRYLSRTD